MGGRSSSSNQTTTQQTTTQQGIEGIVGGDVIQGQDVTIYNDLPEEVRAVFADLIGLVQGSQELAQGAGQLAIEAVAQRAEGAENPELSIARMLVPSLMIVAVGVVAFALFRGKK